MLDSGTLQCSGTPADTTAHSVPTEVSAVAVSGIQVDLSWAPATDNVGVDSYTVYRDGNAIATVAGLTGSVTSATLRVHANSNHSQGFEVQEVADNTWDELSINYTNAPGFGPVLGSSGPTTSGTYVEIDVTGYVNGNDSFSFALTPLNNTNLRLASRETNTPAELLIMQAP